MKICCYNKIVEVDNDGATYHEYFRLSNSLFMKVQGSVCSGKGNPVFSETKVSIDQASRLDVMWERYAAKDVTLSELNTILRKISLKKNSSNSENGTI